MTFFFQGLALGAALILPLGPQNTLVLRQGMFRRYGLTAATFCIISDGILMSAGVFGGSAVLQRSPLLLLLITWAGVLFLLWYSYGLLRQLTHTSASQCAPQHTRLIPILVSLGAVTWLNPHVYLDTFVVLGSIGSQIPAAQRLAFVGGAVSASLLWFYLLAAVAMRLSSWLVRPKIQGVISIIVVVILLTMAFRLANQGVLMWLAYV